MRKLEDADRFIHYRFPFFCVQWIGFNIVYHYQILIERFHVVDTCNMDQLSVIISVLLDDDSSENILQ